jgi:hypothetical protein
VNPKEIIGKLHKSILYLEKAILTPLAAEQIETGNITIANHYGRLNNMYYYFRGQAKSAYLPKEVIDSDDISKHLSALLNSRFRAAKEGAYNSLAMIDAFFSKLEHTLVLLLPFSNYARADDNLAAFIGTNWSEKYKRIFSLESVAKAKSFYDRLDNVKETYRNTFAHGGFDKNGSSIYFHIPGLGAVPASLTDYKNSPHFHFMPVDELNHDEICTLFDEFEKWLEMESAIIGMIYVKSGLDIPLDEEHLTEVHQHCGSIEDFAEWVRAESLYRDMIENVDY